MAVVGGVRLSCFSSRSERNMDWGGIVELGVFEMGGSEVDFLASSSNTASILLNFSNSCLDARLRRENEPSTEHRMSITVKATQCPIYQYLSPNTMIVTRPNRRMSDAANGPMTGRMKRVRMVNASISTRNTACARPTRLCLFLM